MEECLKSKAVIIPSIQYFYGLFCNISMLGKKGTVNLNTGYSYRVKLVLLTEPTVQHRISVKVGSVHYQSKISKLGGEIWSKQATKWSLYKDADWKAYRKKREHTQLQIPIFQGEKMQTYIKLIRKHKAIFALNTFNFYYWQNSGGWNL